MRLVRLQISDVNRSRSFRKQLLVQCAGQRCHHLLLKRFRLVVREHGAWMQQAMTSCT